MGERETIWLCPAALHQCEARERCAYPGNDRTKSDERHECPGPITDRAAGRAALEASK